MAALTATRLGGDLRIPLGQHHIEYWSIPAATAGDTCAITPAQGRFVIAALGGGPSDNNLGTSGASTSVTFTVKTTYTGTTQVMLVIAP